MLVSIFIGLLYLVQGESLGLRGSKQGRCDTNCYKRPEWGDWNGHNAWKECKSYRQVTVTPCPATTTKTVSSVCATATSTISQACEDVKGNTASNHSTTSKCNPSSSEPSKVPDYACKECKLSDYISACSCLGVSSETTTLPQSTVTSTESSTISTTTTSTTEISCPNYINQVQASFISSGIVPTLIPNINPVVKLDISYTGKAVELGNTFSILETTNAPTYAISCDEDPPSTTYSLFLVDPDIPNLDPGKGPMTFLHWYVSGIRVDGTGAQTIESYMTLTPASTQFHRYTFLLYREPAGYMPDSGATLVRLGFNVNTYASNGKLQLIGGNYLLESATSDITT